VLGGWGSVSIWFALEDAIGSRTTYLVLVFNLDACNTTMLQYTFVRVSAHPLTYHIVHDVATLKIPTSAVGGGCMHIDHELCHTLLNGLKVPTSAVGAHCCKCVHAPR
jgi:hypothetical protein